MGYLKLHRGLIKDLQRSKLLALHHPATICQSTLRLPSSLPSPLSSAPRNYSFSFAFTLLSSLLCYDIYLSTESGLYLSSISNELYKKFSSPFAHHQRFVQCPITYCYYFLFTNSITKI